MTIAMLVNPPMNILGDFPFFSRPNVVSPPRLLGSVKAELLTAGCEQEACEASKITDST